MLKLNTSASFRKDYKACVKRGYDLRLLEKVVDTLCMPAPLPVAQREHALSGNWTGYQECHILADWLLIYRISGEEVYLVRTGTHSDLFGK